MNRKINIIGLTLFFTLTLFSFVFSEESMTITTYYPSPYGSYNELTTTGNTYLATTSGSVGIGTVNPSPSARLDVKGPGATASTYGLGVRNSNDVYSLVVRDDGSVGIGTPSPGYKLDVSGQIRTTNDNPVKPNAGQWGGYSDRRLKKNIKPISNAVEKISQIQGITYEWINPELHVSGERAGVVGQDLEKIFPEWVNKIKPEGKDKELIPEGEDALMVTFPGDFNAYLIEAIKELKLKNEALETRIKVLERQISTS